MLGKSEQRAEDILRMIRTHRSRRPGSGSGQLSNAREGGRWLCREGQRSDKRETKPQLDTYQSMTSRGERSNYERMQVLWKTCGCNAHDAMRWDAWQEQNAKRKTKPNHGGKNITHSRKWQELELRIWKVVSGALQHSTTTRGSRPEI